MKFSHLCTILSTFINFDTTRHLYLLSTLILLTRSLLKQDNTSSRMTLCIENISIPSLQLQKLIYTTNLTAKKNCSLGIFAVQGKYFEARLASSNNS